MTDARPASPQERRVRPGEEPHGLLTDVVYYGLGQFLLLGFPTLWLVYVTPVAPVRAGTAAMTAYAAVPVAIWALRRGVVRIGPAWPAPSIPSDRTVDRSLLGHLRRNLSTSPYISVHAQGLRRGIFMDSLYRSLRFRYICVLLRRKV